MKLLFCRACSDAVALLGVERACRCRRSRGAYLDDRRVSISGPCRVLGLSASSLQAHVEKGGDVTAFVMAEPSEFVVRS